MDVFDVVELFHVGISALKRAVDRVVGEVEKEWFVVVAIDEVGGFASECVGQVLGFNDWLPTSDDWIICIIVWFVAPPGMIVQILFSKCSFDN